MAWPLGTRFRVARKRGIKKVWALSAIPGYTFVCIGARLWLFRFWD